ncbi:Protein CBG16211 [Caenorhabditis briggsae]|uniref:Uncharacterized protein n=2 Tax=Caenorhabditis briggsae TaxID=6238 RepID=A0AAE8ZLL6_CAEBR|nr:Protein CBG16211 [Caenorhabditis briggsae]ULT79918.1 hypothetical protein L3Y34_010486 [Caenorhabditis briggsae]UMM39217.1 hypothetical protein L5515_016370 [Caenorhabditis briggsae]CAP34199.1 Protein CBG16211 [Caenorhabditis briggsae]
MVVNFHKSVVFNDSSDFEDDSFITSLKQQRLKGQIPVVTKRYALSITIFFALLFLGISQLIASANQQVLLIRQRYDNVTNGYMDINIPRYIPAPVYFYYELRGSFRMHRSLNQAFCKNQLITGESYGCDTFKNKNYSCEDAKAKQSKLIPGFSSYCVDGQKFYAPVGGTASIMFNDYFKLTLNNVEILWTEEGVISDKLRNAYFEPIGEKDLCNAEMFRNTAKPIGWKQHVCEMGGYRNISLIKWLEGTTNMNFKKFYRILDTKKHDGLKAGVYRLYVDNVYDPKVIPRTEHKMEKYFWILHPTWFGTEQKFLEVMYLIVGGGLLAFSCGLVGFQIFLIDRRKTYDDDDE